MLDRALDAGPWTLDSYRIRNETLDAGRWTLDRMLDAAEDAGRWTLSAKMLDKIIEARKILDIWKVVGQEAGRWT